MPPKKNKKKNVKNDFSFFMDDMKKVLRREGHDWQSPDELVALCHPRWKLLPDHDKARYKQMAKDWKEQQRLDLQSKFDSQGRSLLQVETEQRNRDLQLVQMVKRIEETLANAQEMGVLRTQKFFLIHVNTMCEVDNGDILPCEIALLEFNLKDGILDTFQSFVRPPDSCVPLGYGFKIQSKADETHRLTMDEDPMLHPGSADIGTIVDNILKRVNPGGIREAVTPIYTLPEEEEIVTNVLDNLISWSGRNLGQDFKVYHIHQLFYHLSQYLPKGKRIANCNLAAEDLSSDIYNYFAGLGCPYHDWYDIPRYCSLSVVKRWSYLMMDLCCPALEIERHNYSHIPIEQKSFKNRLTTFSETMLVPWEPQDETVPTQDEYFNVTPFGAPKTRAAPAGYIPVNPYEVVPNEKKMTRKDKEHLTKQLQKEAKAWPSMKPIEQALLSTSNSISTSSTVWGTSPQPIASPPPKSSAWGTPPPPAKPAPWANTQTQQGPSQGGNDDFPDLMSSRRSSKR